MAENIEVSKFRREDGKGPLVSRSGKPAVEPLVLLPRCEAEQKTARPRDRESHHSSMSVLVSRDRSQRGTSHTLRPGKPPQREGVEWTEWHAPCGSEPKEQSETGTKACRRPSPWEDRRGNRENGGRPDYDYET